MPSCPTGTFLYTVRPHDTLWLIAQQYHATINAIATMNPGIDIDNLYVGQEICVPGEFEYYTPYSYSAPIVTNTEEDLNNYMRMLWEQHVFWTRLTILSMVFDLPDVNVVTNRLLQNPKDFAALLEQLYGDTVANEFDNLFTSHLAIAAELVKAAKAGDNAAVADAEKRWYANADEIAAFLARINPYWSQDNWKSMLYEHLALTKTEAVDMLTENYSGAISTLDTIEQQALEMADTMTNGIVNQFPNLFFNSYMY